MEPKGPASEAGVRRRDVLVTWNGAAITDVHALKRGIAEREEPGAAKVSLLRDGQTVEISIAIKIEK